MSRHLGYAASLTALLIASPASAQTAGATSTEAEIAEVRAELARVARVTATLTARLDTLERERAIHGAPEGSSTLTVDHNPQMQPRPQASTVAAGDLNSRMAPMAPTDRAAPGGRDGFAAELMASTDASTVAIKLSTTISDATHIEANFDALTLTASAPLAAGERFSNLGTLDGLSNGARVRFQWSRFVRPFTNPDEQPGYQNLIEKVTAGCLRRLGAQSTACRPQIVTTSFIHENAPELEQAYLELYRMRPDRPGEVDWSARAYGIEGSVGYKQFKYYDLGPIEKREADRTPWSGRAFYTILPDIRRNALTGAVEYQRAYKDATAGAVCPPATPVEINCPTGAVGRPTENDKLLWSLEYRQLFRFGERAFIPAMGLSAMLTYDSQNDVLGVDLPLYLVTDQKSGLTGGIRFGYRDDDDEFVAGVFVGAAFSVP